MTMRATVLPNVDISQLESEVLDESGNLRVMPFKYYQKYYQETIATFCHHYGIYLVPTTELIDFLKEEIGPHKHKALEIGSGNGAVGRALGIRRTDSFLQKEPHIRFMYESTGQPIARYGKDVQKIDGNHAVKKHKPWFVVACWVTQVWKDSDCIEGVSDASVYGVDEGKVIKQTRKYIHVGHTAIHGTKRILALRHRTIRDIPIVSRAMSAGENIIQIWEG